MSAANASRASATAITRSASASPVAADGKLYLSGEDGDIFVVKAGPEYEESAMNKMGELLMASPAISEGMLYVRAKSHLFAIGK